MKITVKLFAGFRDNRFKIAEREYPEATSVSNILADLNINEPELGVALINGRHVTKDHVLTDGATISLFPKVGGG
jgi:molybdopterin converting factor small subunit